MTSLLTYGVVIGAAWGLGAWWVPGRAGTAALDAVCVRLLLGFCALAVLTVAVGSASLAWAAGLTAALGVAGLVLFCLRFPRRGHDAVERDAYGFIEYVSIATVAVALGLALVGASAPVTSWDAATAHLSLAQDYARAGHIHSFQGNPYSAFPHLMHSLFTVSYCLGGEWAAALTSWTFGALACGAVYGLGRRLAGRMAGWAAAGALAAAPIFADQAGTVALDLALAGVVAAAILCVVGWAETANTSWLLAAGILAGSAGGIRHTGYLAAAFLVLAVPFAARDRRGRATGLFVACATLAAAPWLLRTALEVGNPVFPFLPGWFGEETIRDLDPTVIIARDSVERGVVREFLLFPWNLVMHPDRYDGWSKSPGGLVLILGVPGLFVGGRKAWALGLFAWAGLAALFLFRQNARYALPFLVPMMAVAGLAVARLGRLRRLNAAVLVFAFGMGLALHAAAVHFKVPAALGIQSREAYLRSRIERYGAFDWVNRHVEEGVVLDLDRRSAFIEPPTFQSYEALRVLFDMPVEEQAAWLRRRGIRYILLPYTYVQESPAYGPSGFRALFEQWRHCPDLFVLEERLELPRPRGEGTETVEVYRVTEARES